MRCASNLQKCGLENLGREAAHRAERADASRKLSRAAAFCLFFMLVEVVGGLYANSLAVLTDAAHLLTDIAGFAISLFAIWATSWESTAIQSYGFFRLEILGALVSIQFIWLMTGMLLYEATCRLVDSGNDAVDGKVMFVVATLGLFVNIIMIGVLGHDGHSHDLGGHEHHEAHHDHHAGEGVHIRNRNGGGRDHHEHHQNHGHDDERTEHAAMRAYSEQGEHADHALVCTGRNYQTALVNARDQGVCSFVTMIASYHPLRASRER
jgi:zinc transporter 2